MFSESNCRVENPVYNGKMFYIKVCLELSKFPAAVSKNAINLKMSSLLAGKKKMKSNKKRL